MAGAWDGVSRASGGNCRSRAGAGRAHRGWADVVDHSGRGSGNAGHHVKVADVNIAVAWGGGRAKRSGMGTHRRHRTSRSSTTITCCSWSALLCREPHLIGGNQHRGLELQPFTNFNQHRHVDSASHDNRQVKRWPQQAREREPDKDWLGSAMPLPASLHPRALCSCSYISCRTTGGR
jgi:hypothetical protein